MVAALALGVVLLVRGPSSGDREHEVRGLAERFAIALSTYDYRHLDQDLARVRAMGVGHFRYQYEEVLGGNEFRNALRRNKAVATTKVVKGPFIADVTSREARTYTVLEQRVSGQSPSAPQTRRVLVESVLVKTPSGWRIDWVILS